MIHIIETASGIAARQPGISQLPPGVYYYDTKYGLLVDYIADSVPEELYPYVIHACICVDGVYTVVKEAPADLVWQHQFAGWPTTQAVCVEPAE